METTSTAEAFDARTFRTVLGHFPTGVAAVTAVSSQDEPVGMVVGSFTSVSLEPPLVAFMPDRSSSTFPIIRDAGRFCVNVLSSLQEDVCRQLASKGGDKFQGLAWSSSPGGSPVLEQVVAWIDCELVDVIEAGDHYIAIGAVKALEAATADLPLLFFQGGYGSFTPRSLVASHELDLVSQLRWAGLARTEMEDLAQDLDVDCLAAALAEDDLVILASTGRPDSDRSPTEVGQRVPFVAPFGALWLAWADQPRIEAWLPPAKDHHGRELRDVCLQVVDRVRDRGWSLGLGGPTHTQVESLLVSASQPGSSGSVKERISSFGDQLASSYEPADIVGNKLYDVRNISAPVFNSSGDVVLTLTLYGFGHRLQAHEIARYKDRLLTATRRVSKLAATD